MDVGISLKELLAWNEEVADFWKAHLDANPHLLELPCDIGGTKNVRDLVRHIWGAELRWGQRLAGLPVLAKDQMPTGPLHAIFALHAQAMEIFRGLLTADDARWSEPYTLDLGIIPPEKRTMSRGSVKNFV